MKTRIGLNAVQNASKAADEKVESHFPVKVQYFNRQLCFSVRWICQQGTESNYYVAISYTIEAGVCYLALCDAKFSKKLAFGYLEELQREFSVR